METSLHQQLKSHYANDRFPTEVKLGRYRIDVVRDDELIEIQHGSLAAIRAKVATLTEQHPVRVVKPLVHIKQLVKRGCKDGPVTGRRISPKRGRLLDLFHELVYFGTVFPHRNLTLEVPVVDIQEWRFPGHGKRRRWCRRDHQVEDQKLVKIRAIHLFRTSRDLARLIDVPLPRPFHTADLAQALGEPRWFAQRIAYCLRNCGVVRPVGKQGNTRLYQFACRRHVRCA